MDVRSNAREPGVPRSVVIVLAAIALACFASVHPASANHGTLIVQEEGAVGGTHWPNATCDLSNQRLVLPAPDSVTASYDTTNSAVSQRVWWTPRVWWLFKDPVTGVESLNHSDWAQYGWFQTSARTGDNIGSEYRPFIGTGLTGGGAFPAWSDQAGQSLPFDFAAVVPVETANSKSFWAEYIFYWEPNEQQPQHGWDAALSPFWSELLTPIDRCTFR